MPVPEVFMPVYIIATNVFAELVSRLGFFADLFSGFFKLFF